MRTVLRKVISDINRVFKGEILAIYVHPNSSFVADMAMPFSDFDDIFIIHTFGKNELDQAQRAFACTLQDNHMFYGETEMVDNAPPVFAVNNTWVKRGSYHSGFAEVFRRIEQEYPKIFPSDCPPLKAGTFTQPDQKKRVVRSQLFGEWAGLELPVQEAIMRIHDGCIGRLGARYLQEPAMVEVNPQTLELLIQKGYVERTGERLYSDRMISVLRAGWIDYPFTAVNILEHPSR